MTLTEFIAKYFTSIISLILGTSALINIAVFLRRKIEDRKVRAEAEHTEVGTTREVVAMLREEMERKDRELEQLRTDRAEARTQIDKLNTALIEMRIDRDSYRIQLERLLDLRQHPPPPLE
jgi:septal ring factor EnvC (AmiA/AmiB activator)